jgi:hypothetical protein
VLGQSLNGLFDKAKGQPKHYALLHSLMEKHWPEPSEFLKPYDPNKIFREGHEFTLTNPQFANKGLLGSLQDMLDRELVPLDRGKDLIEAALAVWSITPDQAIGALQSGYVALTAEQSADLVDAIDFTNVEQRDLLSHAWSYVLESGYPVDKLKITTRVLEKGLKEGTDGADSALHLWLDVQGNQCVDVLVAVISQHDLNDEHRTRLWQQAKLRADTLGSEFFLEAIPKIVVLSKIDMTANHVFSDFDFLQHILGAADDRAELSKRLMHVFTTVATNTVKALIAEACRKLSGDASLQELNPEEVSDDDLEILKSHIGQTPELRRLAKAREQS